MKKQLNIMFVALLLSLASSCSKFQEQPLPASGNPSEVQTAKPVTLADAAVDTLANPRGRANGEEVQLNKVTNRYVSQGQWQDIFVMQNASFDRSATYLARLYVYNAGAQVDLYASDYIGGGWRVLGSNSSNQFPQKGITFQLRGDTQETRIKVYGRAGQNVRFDLAIYKLSAPAVQRLNVQVSNSNQRTLSHGNIYGYVENVPVYANGSDYGYNGGRSSANGEDVGVKWQCVELVRRFYLIRYGKRMGSNADAKSIYGKASSYGMTAYANGGGMAPRPGDVLCHKADASNANYGHVELVTEVGPDYVLVARQNVYGSAHLNNRIARSGNTLSGNSIQGWIR